MVFSLSTQGLKVEANIVVSCNGSGLISLLRAGEKWLEIHRDIVNSLNVFPVPDGDTGTNMLLTLRSALQEVATIKESDAGDVAASVAYGALMGARGNSGVILSQFLQGIADGLRNKVTFTAKDFARATQLGSDKAYQGVVEPVEGTILTVAQAVSDAAYQSAEVSRDMVAQISGMVKSATVAQAGTPNLLPILKAAGVTDAGGQGLLYILEGWLRFMHNQPIKVNSSKERVPAFQSTPGISDFDFGYDVQFLVRGNRLNVDKIRSYIDSLGWSTVVVGNAQTIKVHVHVNDPDLPLRYGAGLGTISNVVVENLNEQTKSFLQQYAAPLPALKNLSAGQNVSNSATVAVVPGNAGHGFAEIFKNLGATQIVAGGQNMNPNTQSLLKVIDQVDAKNVLILPNNSNIILTAHQAQNLSPKMVNVVPTKTVPQGISALLAFNDQLNPAVNVRNMLGAATQTRTIEITRAARDVTFHGCNIKTGEIIGLLDNNLTSAGQNYHQVVLNTLSQVELDEYEIVTIYFGQGEVQKQAAKLADKIKTQFPELDVEVYDGGQPHYNYIISLE